jgi:hypothetical protein
MVLLDSTSPNGSVQAVSTEPGSYDLPGRFLALLPAAAHLGLARLVSHASYGSLPPRSRDEARASAATARDVKALSTRCVRPPRRSSKQPLQPLTLFARSSLRSGTPAPSTSEAAQLKRRSFHGGASIHNDVQASCLSAFGGGFVDHA